MSRPDAPTPRTDAAWDEEWRMKAADPNSDPAHGMCDFAMQLERELALAQTEIKGHMRMGEELKVTAEAERNCRMEAEGVAAKLQRRLRDEEDKYQGALIRADNIKVELDKAQARIAELEKAIQRVVETDDFDDLETDDGLWTNSARRFLQAALKDRA